MTPADRAAAYFHQKPGAMTPKQRRRARKKAFRDQLVSSRLPVLLHAPADGAGVLSSSEPAPAPAPTGFPSAGVGVTPDSVASASTCATESAPPPVGQTAVHAPTVVVAATVGALGGGS
jgi:hypothetical protein